jgi:hypothetical protein
MIQVTFPVAQRDIKATVGQVRGEIARLDAERQIAIAVLKAIWSLCEHEGQEHYTDRSGYPDSTPCTKCGFTT